MINSWRWDASIMWASIPFIILSSLFICEKHKTSSFLIKWRRRRISIPCRMWSFFCEVVIRGMNPFSSLDRRLKCDLNARHTDTSWKVLVIALPISLNLWSGYIVSTFVRLSQRAVATVMKSSLTVTQLDLSNVAEKALHLARRTKFAVLTHVVWSRLFKSIILLLRTALRVYKSSGKKNSYRYCTAYITRHFRWRTNLTVQSAGMYGPKKR